MRIEISHHIPGYPNYQVLREPNNGRWIKNIKKNTYLVHFKRGNYYAITLSNKGYKKKIYIHRLIAEAFIPNPDNLPQVDHINRIKTDNRIENLRWVTQSENMLNRLVQNNNKLEEKYISYDKPFIVDIKSHNIRQRFDTLQEAIDYRDSLKEELGLIY